LEFGIHSKTTTHQKSIFRKFTQMNAQGSKSGTDQLLKQSHVIKPLESLSSTGESSLLYHFLDSLKFHQSIPLSKTTVQEGPLKPNLESSFESQLSNPLFLENLIKTLQSLQSLHFNLKDAQLTLDPPIQDYRHRLDTLKETLDGFYLNDLQELKQSSLDMYNDLQKFY
jgi:hypothetical protein